MNGILGVTQILKDTELNLDQKKYLEILQMSAEGLLAIIGGILDFSKIEAGKLDIRNEPFRLRQLCEESLGLFSGIVQSKGIKTSLTTHPSLPEWVMGDSVRVRQILVNLIGNSVKFTESGEVALEVSTLYSSR